MKLLHVDSSINGTHSVSRTLSQDIVAAWLNQYPDTQTDYLDLAATAPDHLSQDALGFRSPTGLPLTAEQQRQNALSETLLTQFLEADVVVIGAPLYNFSIPSQLKAWIDRLAQSGRTFKYTDAGVVGLASEKTVILALSRGGVYSSTEAGRAAEHQESYLKTIFGFFGITDVRVVRAEGMDMGDAFRTPGLDHAKLSIGAALIAATESAEVAA